MYALVAIKKPSDINFWSEELKNIDSNRKIVSGTTRLFSGLWLIELETGLSFFGTLLSALQASPNPPPKVVSKDKKHWVEIAMVDQEGNPAAGQNYEIKLPDGSIVTGSLDERGLVRIEGIDPGNCKIRFPTLDKTAWKRR